MHFLLKTPNLPSYSGKQILRWTFAIFSWKRSFLFRNSTMEVAAKHLWLQMLLNSWRLSCILFYWDAKGKHETDESHPHMSVSFTVMFFTDKNQYSIIAFKWLSGNRNSSDMPSESTLKLSSKNGCLSLLTHHFFIFHQNHVIGTECSAEYDASNSLKAMNPLFSLRSLSTHIKHPLQKNSICTM